MSNAMGSGQPARVIKAAEFLLAARRGAAKQPGLPADQLAGLGHLEAPCGAPVALHLGHGVSLGG